MCHILSLLILVGLGLADILPGTNSEKVEEYNTTSSWCDSPFQILNNGCYFFSDIQRDYEGAASYCKSLNIGHYYEVTLAILNYDLDDDHALLKTVTELDNIFWVGGRTEDGIRWRWLNRQDIYLLAPFWDISEPNEEGNMCMAAQKNKHSLSTVSRSYIYDHACGDSLDFICQKIKCPANFIKLGNYCYLQSWTLGLPTLNWQDSRDYCRSLDVHDGYHGDLTVLGLQDQDNYHLMAEIITGYSDFAWIGAYRESSECSFLWVDDRELPLESSYWANYKPTCGDDIRVGLGNFPNFREPFIADGPGINAHPFICQMFPTF